MYWEYRLVEFVFDRDSERVQELNRLGVEGWEAVSMVSHVEQVQPGEPMPLTGHRERERTVLVVLLKRPSAGPVI